MCKAGLVSRLFFANVLASCIGQPHAAGTILFCSTIEQVNEVAESLIFGSDCACQPIVIMCVSVMPMGLQSGLTTCAV